MRCAQTLAQTALMVGALNSEEGGNACLDVLLSTFEGAL